MESTGGEEVNDFLQRIRELGDKRDREDDERTKQLERDIIAGREARRARRDERARSISPLKDSPGTPLSLASLASSRPGTRDGDDRAGHLDQAGALEKLTGKLEDFKAEKPEALNQEPSRAVPTLAWQRRARTSTSGQPRPLSVGRAEALGESQPEAPDRSEIAASLGSKEPAWFKQTVDRNATSKALRKPQDEAIESSARMALPGMSGREEVQREAVPEVTPEPEKTPLLSSRGSAEALPSTTRLTRSDSLKAVERLVSSRSTPGLNRHGRGASVSNTASGRFDLTASDTFPRPMPMSPSQGRISPERAERSTSPTKNFMGFAESAKLKRDGSVSKRWSNAQVQSGPHPRQTPGASIRPRPTSSYNELSLTMLSRESSPGSEDVTGPDASLSKSAGLSTSGSGEKKDSSPPILPTKTFDQKRWSPTKSSWLESALKKGNDAAPVPSTAKPQGRSFPVIPLKAPENTNGPPEVANPPTKPKSPLISPNPPGAPATSAMEPIKSTPRAKPPEISPKPTIPMKSAAFAKPALKSPATISTPGLEKPGPNSKPVPGPKQELNFRASLKPRVQADKGGEKEELPFLDARSRLRASRTQNYKAPDALKERILEGRSTLTKTDGPQKTTKPDALKEKVASAKAHLRSNTVTSLPSPTKNSPAEVKARPPEPVKQVSTPAKLEEKKGSLASRFNPNLANLLQKGPSAATARDAPSTGAASSSITSSKSTMDGSSAAAGSVPLVHMTKARARGPKRRAPTKVESPGSVVDLAGHARMLPSTPKPSSMSSAVLPVSQPLSTKQPNTPSEASSLLRAHKSTPALGVSRFPITPNKPPVVGKLALESLATGASSPPKPLETLVKQQSPSVSSVNESVSSVDKVPSSVSYKAKPLTPAKSPLLRSASSSDIKEKATETPSIEAAMKGPIKIPSLPSAKSPSSSASSEIGSKEATISRIYTPDPERDVGEELNTSMSVKSAASFWGQSAKIATPSRQITKSPSLPSRSPTPSSTPKAPTPTIVSSTLLPKTPSKSSTVSSAVSTKSPSAKELSDFFKGPFFRTSNANIDVEKLLKPSPSVVPEPVKTIQLEVSEISGHGKLKRVSRDEEHVFFDERMYLCIHKYQDASRRAKVDVYLWSGLQVPSSAVEDSQLFARKIAGEQDAQLIRLQQGLETASFFQAIGGILITRRGTPENFDLFGPFMLCGRSCPGGIALDDVKMTPSSLCSGFPYIISWKGIVYLWKGKGSTPDELGITRLVALDISGGDVVEIAEGDEPEELFDALGSDERPPSADYWRLKPTCKKYAARLFRIDTQLPSKVVEISPFCQSLLDPHDIYVMDAFFEFYIVLGAKAQSKREEFQTALQFTQDYSILAVSVDDRPFIPVSSVILGGAPREFRALFRTWEDSKSPTNTKPTGMRKSSLRLIGLDEAMKIIEPDS